MRVRIIELINNYYMDDMTKNNSNIPIKTNEGKPLGSYCCLGHFDALDFQLINTEGQMDGEDIWKACNKDVVKNLDGTCNRRNIVCITDDDVKEEKFWNLANSFPCLFISWIRLKKANTKDLKEIIKTVNEENDMMAYYTYDHSELTIIWFGNSYSKGIENIALLYDKMEVFKMYSVFAIKEDALDRGDLICDEIVDCRLSATVKDRNCVNEYTITLKEILNRENVVDGFDVTMFDVLGNSDIMILISKVSLKKLLCCYKMGRILTHSNQIYQKAFFNVESQILMERNGWE